MTDARSSLLAGGLEPEGGGIPVNHFKGRMVDFEATVVEPKAKGGSGNAYTQVMHKVTELLVIESKEPFDFEALEFPISASTRERTKWGIWVKSIATLAGVDLTEVRDDGSKVMYEELFDTHLRGNMVEIKRNIHQLRRKDPKTGDWGDEDVPCWEVIGIEGVGSAAETPEDVALRHYAESGGDQIAFKRAVLSDPVVSANKELLTAIDNGTWIPAMIEAGKVTQTDNG